MYGHRGIVQPILACRQSRTGGRGQQPQPQQGRKPLCDQCSPRDARDPQTFEKVLVPDDVIGGAFVLKVSEKTSLALVTRSRTEILIGDRFRSKRY